jgi:2-polyprenyl-3-methyl-5-hydroxy-6-metoxy-1,4-benzoquinol methylase
VTRLDEWLTDVHVRVGRMIDRAFPPLHSEGEIIAWDRYWSERFSAAEQSGFFPEIHGAGKQWLYDRVIDAIVRCAGGSVTGKTIAEFGCGSGCATIRLAERGARPVLIDASHEALRYARRLADHLGYQNRCDFVTGDLTAAEELGLFDFTFNSGVLEHYPPEGAAEMLRNMARVTRPGGHVLVILPNLIAPAFLVRMMRTRSKGSERFYSQWLLARVFDAAGLKNSRHGHVRAYLTAEAPAWARTIFEPLLSGLRPGLLGPLFYRWAEVGNRSP